MAKFSAGVKAASSHAISTRQTIRNYPDTLIDLTNDLLETANEILQKNGRERGLLLLFDNLDRYSPDHIDRVLFRGNELVRRLKSHALFTIPISLEYDAPSGATQDCFGFSMVLPMLAVRNKVHSWADTVAASPYDDAAVAKMREALARRMDLNLFAEASDVDLLVKTSGGCMRDLLHLVTLAFTNTDDEKCLTPDSVREAIRTMRASYLRKLTPGEYAKLAAIARTKKLATDESEAEVKENRRLLFNRFALEYLDNDGSPWVDVHPVVIETEEFRRAYSTNRVLANR
jgi:hypothetical protein